MAARKYLGIGGKAGVGKDTLSHALIQILNTQYKLTTASFAFADPIKDMIRAMLYEVLSASDVDKYLNSPTFKNEPIPHIGVSYRVLAQELGTSWGQGIRKDLWIRIMEQRLRKYSLDIAIFSDVRFQHEADWIRSKGGRCIYIDGDSSIESDHISENMDLNWYDLTYINDKTKLPNEHINELLQYTAEYLLV